MRAFLDHGRAGSHLARRVPDFRLPCRRLRRPARACPLRDDRNDLEALATAAHRIERAARLPRQSRQSHRLLVYRQRVSWRFWSVYPRMPAAFSTRPTPSSRPPESLLPLDTADPRIIRMRTFSKAYGMAGARIGYAIATPEMIATFDKIRLHFGVNLVAQAGALASLADTDYLASVTAAVATGRDEYAALAAELGLTALPSATNFVTIDVGGPERARALVAALAERGVFIRMPGAPPLDRCVRVTVGTPAERALFGEILRETWPAVAAAASA